MKCHTAWEIIGIWITCHCLYRQCYPNSDWNSCVDSWCTIHLMIFSICPTQICNCDCEVFQCFSTLHAPDASFVEQRLEKQAFLISLEYKGNSCYSTLIICKYSHRTESLNRTFPEHDNIILYARQMKICTSSKLNERTSPDLRVQETSYQKLCRQQLMQHFEFPSYSRIIRSIALVFSGKWC